MMAYLLYPLPQRVGLKSLVSHSCTPHFSLSLTTLVHRLVAWLISPLDRLEKEIAGYLKPFIEARKEEIMNLEKDETDTSSVRDSLLAV